MTRTKKFSATKPRIKRMTRIQFNILQIGMANISVVIFCVVVLFVASVVVPLAVPVRERPSSRFPRTSKRPKVSGFVRICLDECPRDGKEFSSDKNAPNLGHGGAEMLRRNSPQTVARWLPNRVAFHWAETGTLRLQGRGRQGCHPFWEEADMTDYYAVLRVPPAASVKTISAAYRRLALRYHPDRQPPNAVATKIFERATEAFEVLSDPHRRAAFDRACALHEDRQRGPHWILRPFVKRDSARHRSATALARLGAALTTEWPHLEQTHHHAEILPWGPRGSLTSG